MDNNNYQKLGGRTLVSIFLRRQNRRHPAFDNLDPGSHWDDGRFF